MRVKTKTADMKKYMREYVREWRKKHRGYQPNTDASILKACTKCGETKPATAEFFQKERTRTLGLSSWCKECATKKTLKWRAANREKCLEATRVWRRKHQRKYSLRYGYGLTVEQYDAMLNAQGGVCAICGAPPKDNKKRRLVVDHDHKTEKNRGLLCIKCNNTLERMESIPDWHERALTYLVKYEIGAREKEFK
jgi:hypothetical protein